MADEKTTTASSTGPSAPAAALADALLAPPVEGEPSSHETCGADPAGQVAETFPGTSTDPQTTKGAG